MAGIFLKQQQPGAKYFETKKGRWRKRLLVPIKELELVRQTKLFFDKPIYSRIVLRIFAYNLSK